MEFIEKYPVSKLNSADYNPRKIKEGSFEDLKKSLLTFGIVKPVILNGANGILTAGHQRTKAMKAVNIEYAPVIILSEISLKDEIRFNLFHNSIETNKSIVKVNNIDKYKLGFNFVNHENIDIVKRDNATIVTEIGKLISRYGAWGSVVVDEDGNVIENSDYAVAIKCFKDELLIYKMENSKIDLFKYYISKEYGEYYYETLGIKPYNQLYCQLPRLTEDQNRKQSKSMIYENKVISDLKKDDRIVDFGAGKCAYVNKLHAEGYSILAYEPHYQKPKTNSIDIRKVVGFINAICSDIKKNGLYDKVVLDSVLNSITSTDFEDYVLTACNSLLKRSGKLYVATRNIQGFEKAMDYTYTTEQKKKRLEFLDSDNFSATFRRGVWTLQKFHTKETLYDLLNRYFEKVEISRHSSNMFHAICTIPKDVSIDKVQNALNIEFNMEYPNNYRHNRHTNLVEEIIKNVKAR